MRNEAALEAVQKDGATARAHLLALARRGKLDADDAARLDGPPYPAALRYLDEWSQALFGRSGVGMHGMAPLSYSTIADWARLMDVTVQPHEVEALLILDAIRAHPSPSGTGSA